MLKFKYPYLLHNNGLIDIPDHASIVLVLPTYLSEIEYHYQDVLPTHKKLAIPKT
uniref:Uncharacterized protein n=1 Tax=Megaviridae environmental sample TaxID=1737588 RepID=A0A5J6VIZ3_9VIRU|nr:MAG: hypothetical protein [Megaviridae environmental sample]